MTVNERNPLTNQVGDINLPFNLFIYRIIIRIHYEQTHNYAVKLVGGREEESYILFACRSSIIWNYLRFIQIECVAISECKWEMLTLGQTCYSRIRSITAALPLTEWHKYISGTKTPPLHWQRVALADRRHTVFFVYIPAYLCHA